MSKTQAYNWISWGFVFLLLNFYLQGINVFADVVGYVLIAVAVSHLKDENRWFQKAYSLCFPLIILSLPNAYQVSHSGSGFFVNLSGSSPFIYVLDSLYWIGSCFLVYYLYKGTKDLAVQKQETTLVRQSVVSWYVFLGLQVGGAVLIALYFLHLSPWTTIIGVVLLIYSLVVLGFYLTWFANCRASLS